MVRNLPKRILFAAVVALTAPLAGAQAEGHAPGMRGGGMGPGMMDMMQNCPHMAQRGGAPHALPRLPAGNEKLELQMHADMMRAVADVLGKYAARLPDKK